MLEGVSDLRSASPGHVDHHHSRSQLRHCCQWPPLEEGRIVGGGPIVPCDTPLGREVQRQGSRIHCPIGQLREGDEEQCSPPFLWPDDSTQEDISH